MIVPSSVSAVISSTSGKRRAVDDERVVARRFERIGQPGEHALVAVVDERRLAVHHRRGAHHVAAEHLADRLMAEAHTEDRARAGEAFDDRVRESRILGATGSR